MIIVIEKEKVKIREIFTDKVDENVVKKSSKKQAK